MVTKKTLIKLLPSFGIIGAGTITCLKGAPALQGEWRCI